MAGLVSVLSSMKIAGAIALADHAEFPASPALGTIVIKGAMLYAFITVAGVQTWYPMVKAKNSHIFTQSTAALDWTVSHSLNVSDVWYQVQDANGQVMQPAAFEKIDANSFRLKFSEATNGKVLVIGEANMDVPLMRASQIEVGTDVVLTTSDITVKGMSVSTEAKLVDHGSVIDGAEDLAYGLASSSLHRLQVGAALTLTTSGWPAAGQLGEMLLELVNGAAFAITWPTIHWIKSDGTSTTSFASNEVTLQANGTDWVMLWTRDGGATIYGKVLR